MTREEFNAKLPVINYLANDIVSKIKRRNEYYDILCHRIKCDEPQHDKPPHTPIQEEITMLRKLLLEVSKNIDGSFLWRRDDGK